MSKNPFFKILRLLEGLKGIYCLLEWKECYRENTSEKKLAVPETTGLFTNTPLLPLLCEQEIHMLVLKHQSHVHIHTAGHHILDPLFFPITH